MSIKSMGNGSPAVTDTADAPASHAPSGPASNGSAVSAHALPPAAGLGAPAAATTRAPGGGGGGGGGGAGGGGGENGRSPPEGGVKPVDGEEDDLAG